MYSSGRLFSIGHESAQCAVPLVQNALYAMLAQANGRDTARIKSNEALYKEQGEHRCAVLLDLAHVAISQC